MPRPQQFHHHIARAAGHIQHLAMQALYSALPPTAIEAGRHKVVHAVIVFAAQNCGEQTHAFAFMLINALLHASDEERSELQHWVGCKDCNSDEKIKAVTSLYTKIGVDRMAQERMNAYYAEAEACLDEVKLPEERKQMLRRIALELMGRQS